MMDHHQAISVKDGFDKVFMKKKFLIKTFYYHIASDVDDYRQLHESSILFVRFLYDKSQFFHSIRGIPHAALYAKIIFLVTDFPYLLLGLPT